MSQKKKSSFTFGGTAYLGIPGNNDFLALVVEGIGLYGVNYGASRNNNLTLKIYREAECEISRRFKSESSIVLSSGYLAAQLVVQWYFKTHKLIYAPETHPALWLGKPDPPDLMFTEWIRQTVKTVNSSNEPVLIITNSLNNLHPEIYDFQWLANIAPGRAVTVLVDDSHGLGITGENGEGVYSRIPKMSNIRVIVAASMAKGLGIDAGIVLSDKNTIEELKNSPVYAGSSPPAPGILHAWMKAEGIYYDQLQKLRRNISLFEDMIKEKSEIHFTPGFPVYLLEDPDAGKKLQALGLQISSFPYPDPQSKPLNRAVITSLHNEKDLEILAGPL